MVLAAAGALLEDVSFVVSLCGVSWRRTPWIAMVRRSKENHTIWLYIYVYIYISVDFTHLEICGIFKPILG